MTEFMNIHSVDLCKSMVSYASELRRCTVLCTVKFNTISNAHIWYINLCSIADRRHPGHESYTIEVRNTGVVVYVYNNILTAYDRQ